MCDEEDLDRGSLRRNRRWWVNRLRREKGINCERKMTRRDVHEGATRTTANDTSIPELVRDVLDWPAFRRTETELAAARAARERRD